MVLACCLSQMDAQIHIGIKGGLNFMNFSLKNAGDELTFNNSTGWQIGALLQVGIPVVGLGVQPELLYTVKKAKVDDVSSSIHYFEVPLNVQWGFKVLFLRPYVMAGPYFGYAVDFNGDVFNSQIDRFVWGIGLGAGIEFRKLQLGARYSWGLQNVRVRDFELKNNMFTLSLAVLF